MNGQHNKKEGILFRHLLSYFHLVVETGHAPSLQLGIYTWNY